MPTPTVEPPGLLPTANVRILRIEPSIRGVNLKQGEVVRLSVRVYGSQDIRDDDLCDHPQVSFAWNAQQLSSGSVFGAGALSESVTESQDRTRNGGPDDRHALYTAPGAPGRHVVTAALEPGTECLPKRDHESEQDALDHCTAVFEVTVLRPTTDARKPASARDPEGEIPTILTDSEGEQYEVFTPEGGGTFTGTASSLSAGPGVVPNGEIVGLRIAEGGSASNECKTYQRYNLGGSWYEISAVDSSNNSVSSYGLSDAVEVCVPLPDALRSNISDLAVVAINSDDSLTILSSSVRISPSGTKVCGSLSSVPATVAVGTTGSPAPLPTEVPEMEKELPDTGGAGLSSNQALVWLLIIGLTVVVSGYAILHAARRGTNKIRQAPEWMGEGRYAAKTPSTTQFNGLNARRQGRGRESNGGMPTAVDPRSRVQPVELSFVTQDGRSGPYSQTRRVVARTTSFAI